MLESARADPWDEIIVMDMASTPAISRHEGIRWLRSEVNMGPAAGRNRIADAAASDILFFLDDDSRLLSPAYAMVAGIFDANPKLALIALKIQRRDGRVLGSEYPFRGPVPHTRDHRRPCPYFVGAGYACRRSAVQAVGGYDEALFIHGEELDLSFGLLGAGWELLYEPGILVEHCPSDSGRAPEAYYWPWTMRNRARTARKYLPLIVATIHLTLWAGLTLWRSASTGGLRHWPTETLQGLRTPVDRQTLSWSTMRKLHEMGGRVFW
jgi:GT2 family glycosyltransferase